MYKLLCLAVCLLLLSSAAGSPTRPQSDGLPTITVDPSNIGQGLHASPNSGSDFGPDDGPYRSHPRPNTHSPEHDGGNSTTTTPSTRTPTPSDISGPSVTPDETGTPPSVGRKLLSVSDTPSSDTGHHRVARALTENMTACLDVSNYSIFLQFQALYNTSMQVCNNESLIFLSAITGSDVTFSFSALSVILFVACMILNTFLLGRFSIIVTLLFATGFALFSATSAVTFAFRLSQETNIHPLSVAFGFILTTLTFLYLTILRVVWAIRLRSFRAFLTPGNVGLTGFVLERPLVISVKKLPQVFAGCLVVDDQAFCAFNGCTKTTGVNPPAHLTAITMYGKTEYIGSTISAGTITVKGVEKGIKSIIYSTSTLFKPNGVISKARAKNERTRLSKRPETGDTMKRLLDDDEDVVYQTVP